MNADFRPVVVTPTYNNACTIMGILDRIDALKLPVVVVNDGCTDATAELLGQWKRADRDTAAIVIIHERNRGKGAALKSGFAAATAAGFTHATTIDTDGQLDPGEIPRLLEAARRYPQSLVLGFREENADGYLARSRLGRWVSNMMVRAESGLSVQDSQCGFRVYPLGLIAAVPCRGRRFTFETEILTRAGWAGCPVIEVPVKCRYLPAGQRVSHFRPWLDSIRGIATHTRLTAAALSLWPRSPRWPGAEPARTRDPLLRRLWEWISPAKAWRQLRQDRVARRELAAGLAVGVFIANLPLYGLQSILSLYAARRLHLHPLSVLAGSHISTPPLGPLLVAGAIGLGHLLFHGCLPAMADYDPRHMPWSAILGPLLLEWSVGGFLMGCGMAVITFFTAAEIMRWMGKTDGRNIPEPDCLRERF